MPRKKLSRKRKTPEEAGEEAQDLEGKRSPNRTPGKDNEEGSKKKPRKP